MKKYLLSFMLFLAMTGMVMAEGNAGKHPGNHRPHHPRHHRVHHHPHR
jgi:hypothetical protein